MGGTRRLFSRCSAVISDVDGTLVTGDKVLTPRAVAAVAKLRTHGIGFSIISSRPPRGLRMFVKPLGLENPIGGFNGGMIAAPDLSAITAHLLEPAVARRAVDMLDARNVQVWIFSEADWLVREPTCPYVALEQRTIGFPPTVVGSFARALDIAAKIVGVSANFDLLAQCEGDLRDVLGAGASVARSQPYYLDITHPLANKGAALAEIATLMSIPLSEIAVIGDGGNDVAMFERSGLAIAMGNASLAVRQVADFVTDSNQQDGFANAVERFILGDVDTGMAADPVQADDRANASQPAPLRRTASET